MPTVGVKKANTRKGLPGQHGMPSPPLSKTFLPFNSILISLISCLSPRVVPSK
jgi:hypothetical protein